MQTSRHHGTRRGLGLALAAVLAVLGLAMASSAQAACFGQKVTIKGTPGADRIKGTNGRDVIYAGGGNDRINGKGGPDVICAGPGKDRASGAIGRDEVGGGLGSDKVSGGNQGDDLYGEEGDDKVRGGKGTTTSTGSRQRQGPGGRRERLPRGRGRQ